HYDSVVQVLTPIFALLVLYLQTRTLAECGATLIERLPIFLPNFSSVQKSLTLLARGRSKAKSCAKFSQLNRQKTSRSGNLIEPTLSESSLKRAATPVGGCSLRS